MDIKVRAWDAKRGKMLDGDFIEDCHPTYRVSLAYGKLAIYDTTGGNLEQLPTMLATGLYDKNGKLVYAGDMLRTPHFVRGSVTYYLYHVVEWSEKYTGWFARSTAAKHDDDGSIQLWVYAKNTGCREVAGNIYEHSHLLK